MCVAQRTDAEHPVVDEVTEEDRAPPVGGVRLEGLEQPLQVAMDVADDQDRQIVRSQASPSPSTRLIALV